MTCLSTRQRQILGMAANGLSNQEIADELGLTLGTVKNHMDTVYERLGVNKRAHAVAVAFRTGVLT